MKRNIGIVCVMLSVLLMLSACMAYAASGNRSIFQDIRLDGIHTHYKSLKAGMTPAEVMEKEHLTQEDVEIQETVSAIDGRLVTLMRTNAETEYAEADGFGFQKIYYFRDGGLLQLSLEKNFDGTAFEDGIVKAREFMVNFVQGSGAVVMGSGDGLQYHAYGEMPTRADEKAFYEVQFAYGGILSMLDIYTQDMRDIEWYDGDSMLTVSIGLNFERYGYDHKVQ